MTAGGSLSAELSSPLDIARPTVTVDCAPSLAVLLAPMSGILPLLREDASAVMFGNALVVVVEEFFVVIEGFVISSDFSFACLASANNRLKISLIILKNFHYFTVK